MNEVKTLPRPLLFYYDIILPVLTLFIFPVLPHIVRAGYETTVKYFCRQFG
ncbi:MAG: hypothetical protein ACI4JK_07805 [Oscillospiraceae bacterium]